MALMAFRAALKPSQKASIHPQAVVFQRLLSLPLCDLRCEIQHQSEQNPALEFDEEWLGSDGPEAHSFERHGGQVPREAAEDGDGFVETAARISLQQDLWESLALAVSDSLTRRIAYYLIHNLNDDGYLCCNLDEAASHFGVEMHKAQDVLRLVQELEPPGVGARDLRECLLIQVRRLRGQGVHPQAEAILESHWEAFARRRFDVIARKARISVREVREAADFIRARLAPYPGRGHRLPWQPPTALPQQPAPDVIVRKNNGRWEAEIAQGVDCRLRLSPSYLEVHRQTRANGVGYTPDERRHVAGCLRTARLFLEALDQRRRTLKRIAGLIVSLEGQFFEQGVEGLVPLSRRALARRLGVHPSTVSRALASKHLLTSTGAMVPFDIFFDRSVLAKETIRRLVEREEKGRPFSDQDIADSLARRGIRWARRTVAKYREQIGILSRSKRGLRR